MFSTLSEEPRIVNLEGAVVTALPRKVQVLTGTLP
jgi:hypothetical protein